MHQVWDMLYDKTRELIVDNSLQGINEDKIWFRPPYGQRHLALITYIAKLNDKVMLWNIDSQDWNRKLKAKEIENRVITLMLLHRKGIILFHDTHSKALASITTLNKMRINQSIVWINCKDFAP